MMKEHFRDRKKEVSMIIIHSMSEYIGEEYAYDFLDRMGLSAHFLVDSIGNVIYGPSIDKVAFHAGLSFWEGEHNLNNISIGIELLINNTYDWETFKKAIKKPESFTEKHYELASKICKDLMNIYPKITKDRILRHSDVSGKEVRPDPKIDPGEGFSLSKLKSMI